MIEGLRPYADLVATGVDWIPAVPAHWDVRRSKYLAREVDKRSVTGDETHLSMNQRLGLVPSSESTQRRLVSESYVGGKLVAANDLVLNRLKAHLGVFAYASQPGVISPDYSVFRPEPSVDVRYLEFVLKSPACRGELRTRTKGIVEGFWRLYTDDFYDIRLPQPSLEEQRLIVRFLDWHGGMTARLIRAKKRLIALLNEQKQSIIHHAVTRGLDPTAPLKPSGVDWLGDVPEGWEVKRLKWVAHNVVDQTDHCPNDQIYVALEDIESWTGRLLRKGHSDIKGAQLKRFLPSDVLFGKLRPYLAKVVRPQTSGVCVGELLVLRADAAAIESAFLEIRLRASDFIAHVNQSTFGAKMPRADWGFIGGTPIAYPSSLSEQRAILQHIQSATRELANLSSRISSEITLIQEFRTRLIADVVTGQLDVRALAATLPAVTAVAPPGEPDDDAFDEDADALEDEEADA